MQSLFWQIEISFLIANVVIKNAVFHSWREGEKSHYIAELHLCLLHFSSGILKW